MMQTFLELMIKSPDFSENYELFSSKVSFNKFITDQIRSSGQIYLILMIYFKRTSYNIRIRILSILVTVGLFEDLILSSVDYSILFELNLGAKRFVALRGMILIQYQMCRLQGGDVHESLLVNQIQLLSETLGFFWSNSGVRFFKSSLLN